MSERIFEMWKCGKKGKHVGCAQGCETEYGTYDCWECPDKDAPSHAMIKAHMATKKAFFGEAFSSKGQKGSLLGGGEQ